MSLAENPDVQAPMESVGYISLNPSEPTMPVFFADRTFANPGLYVWNGKRNVLVVGLDEMEEALR